MAKRKGPEWIIQWFREADPVAARLMFEIVRGEISKRFPKSGAKRKSGGQSVRVTAPATTGGSER